MTGLPIVTGYNTREAITSVWQHSSVLRRSLPAKAEIEPMEISFRSKSDRTETVGAKVN